MNKYLCEECYHCKIKNLTDAFCDVWGTVIPEQINRMNCNLYEPKDMEEAYEETNEEVNEGINEEET